MSSLAEVTLLVHSGIHKPISNYSPRKMLNSRNKAPGKGTDKRQ